MLVALDIQSNNPWEIAFPVLEKRFTVGENDACKSPVRKHLIAVFWWNLLPNGTFDARYCQHFLGSDSQNITQSHLQRGSLVGECIY